jgi:hypothetical protein
MEQVDNSTYINEQLLFAFYTTNAELIDRENDIIQYTNATGQYNCTNVYIGECTRNDIEAPSEMILDRAAGVWLKTNQTGEFWC